MKNLKYVKTFENFNSEMTNEEMIPLAPGPGFLGALYGPFLPFLIAIQSTKAVYDRVKFRKAKRFLGDFFEKIANDPVIKQIADGFITGSIFPKKPNFHQSKEIRKREIQKAIDRIKEISKEGDYEKFLKYMSYMNNEDDDWKQYSYFWPVLDKNPIEIGSQKRFMSYLDVDDTLGDIEDIAKKIASKF